MAIIANLKKKFYFVAAGYFKFFANISLKRWHPRIIIITGSAGKTTMLNLVESQLGDKAHYSHNANSAFGIAFDVLGQRGNGAENQQQGDEQCKELLHVYSPLRLNDSNPSTRIQYNIPRLIFQAKVQILSYFLHILTDAAGVRRRTPATV